MYAWNKGLVEQGGSYEGGKHPNSEFRLPSPPRIAYTFVENNMSNKELAHTQHHKDGSVWAVGHLQDGATTGYWEWFRKDGTKSRSGHFDNGHQVGEWITYDKTGKPHKVTQMKPKDTSAKIHFTGCSE